MQQELIECKSHKSIKIKTLSKSHLDPENYLFHKRLFDTCKLNNFLNKNVFPIENIYSNKFFVVLEDANDE